MALTNTQKKDATYLASLLENTKQQREKALRDATVNTQQALRRVKQYNALNGFQGGPEESSYLLVHSKGNADIAAINAQFNPLIAEYQTYLDAIRAQQAARGGGGGRARSTGRQAYTGPIYQVSSLGGTQAALDAARRGMAQAGVSQSIIDSYTGGTNTAGKLTTKYDPATTVLENLKRQQRKSAGRL